MWNWNAIPPEITWYLYKVKVSGFTQLLGVVYNTFACILQFKYITHFPFMHDIRDHEFMVHGIVSKKDYQRNLVICLEEFIWSLVIKSGNRFCLFGLVWLLGIAHHASVYHQHSSICFQSSDNMFKETVFHNLYFFFLLSRSECDVILLSFIISLEESLICIEWIALCSLLIASLNLESTNIWVLG